MASSNVTKVPGGIPSNVPTTIYMHTTPIHGGSSSALIASPWNFNFRPYLTCRYVRTSDHYARHRIFGSFSFSCLLPSELDLHRSRSLSRNNQLLFQVLITTYLFWSEYTVLFLWLRLLALPRELSFSALQFSFLTIATLLRKFTYKFNQIIQHQDSLCRHPLSFHSIFRAKLASIYSLEHNYNFSTYTQRFFDLYSLRHSRPLITFQNSILVVTRQLYMVIYICAFVLY